MTASCLTTPTGPCPLQIFKDMGADKLFDPKRYVLCLDHSAPSPAESIANVHSVMREFARENQSPLFEVGEGVCHQLMLENGLALPGELIIGSDSHTCTYGALNAFATGMGSTDLAMALATGRQWFKVPQTIKIELTGKLPPGVFAKDIVLDLAGRVGADGAGYKALEFAGDGLAGLSMEERFTLSNMAVEMGAKAGLMAVDETALTWLKERGHSDFNPATGGRKCNLPKNRVLRPERAHPPGISASPGGQCVAFNRSGRYTHPAGIHRLLLQRALVRPSRGRPHPKGQKSASAVPLDRVPGLPDAFSLRPCRRGWSRPWWRPGPCWACRAAGLVGATTWACPVTARWLSPPATAISREGWANRRAEIYLASPAAVAAAAIQGKIADPRRFWE